MLIGEVENKTNLSRDTIRFYEKKGLIKVGRSDSEWNNYKDYNQEALDKLFLIKKAKGFGFTLNEISEILEMFDDNMATCEIMSLKVKEKLTKIDQKIKDLNDIKMMIIGRIQNIPDGCKPQSSENCQNL